MEEKENYETIKGFLNQEEGEQNENQEEEQQNDQEDEQEQDEEAQNEEEEDENQQKDEEKETKNNLENTQEQNDQNDEKENKIEINESQEIQEPQKATETKKDIKKIKAQQVEVKQKQGIKKNNQENKQKKKQNKKTIKEEILEDQAILSEPETIEKKGNKKENKNQEEGKNEENEENEDGEIVLKKEKKNKLKQQNKKRSASQERREKQRIQIIQKSKIELRNRLQSALQKLQTFDTRENGMKEFREILSDDQYKEIENLPIYLECLCDGKKSYDTGAQECELLILGYLCKLYKKDLIDPNDKNPSLETTVLRIVEQIHRYFVVSQVSVQQSCAKALADVYNYCLPGDNLANQMMIIFDPLIDLVSSGGERVRQSTAILCLYDLIILIKSQRNAQMIENLKTKIMNAFYKVNTEFYLILDILEIYFTLYGQKLIEGKYYQFVNKLLSFLNKPQGGLNNIIMTKIKACNLFKMIGSFMKDEQILDKIEYQQVVESLQETLKDKNINVQKEAIEAIRVWEKAILKDQTKMQQFIKKGQSQSPLGSKSPTLNNFKALREKFKMEKKDSLKKIQKDEFDKDHLNHKLEENSSLEILKKDVFELVKQKGFGAVNRGSQFIKSRSGTGGGFCGEGIPRKGLENLSKKSHEKRLKDLKEMIQKGVQKQGFEGIEENISLVENKSSELAQGKGNQKEFLIRPKTAAGGLQNSSQKKQQKMEVQGSNKKQNLKEQNENQNKFESTKILVKRLEEMEEDSKKKQKIKELNQKINQFQSPKFQEQQSPQNFQNQLKERRNLKKLESLNDARTPSFSLQQNKQQEIIFQNQISREKQQDLIKDQNELENENNEENEINLGNNFQDDDDEIEKLYGKVANKLASIQKNQQERFSNLKENEYQDQENNIEEEIQKSFNNQQETFKEMVQSQIEQSIRPSIKQSLTTINSQDFQLSNNNMQNQLQKQQNQQRQGNQRNIGQQENSKQFDEKQIQEIIKNQVIQQINQNQIFSNIQQDQIQNYIQNTVQSFFMQKQQEIYSIMEQERQKINQIQKIQEQEIEQIKKIKQEIQQKENLFHQKRNQIDDNYKQNQTFDSNKNQNQFSFNNNLQNHFNSVQNQNSQQLSSIQQQQNNEILQDSLIDIREKFPTNLQKQQKQNLQQNPKQQNNQQQSENYDDILIWKQALIYLNDQNYESAFRIILNEDDDIFLIRLMTKTGSCLGYLSQQTSIQVINRLNQIVKGDYINQMGISLFEDAFNYGLMNTFINNEKQDLIQQLLVASESENQQIGPKAAQLEKDNPIRMVEPPNQNEQNTSPNKNANYSLNQREDKNNFIEKQETEQAYNNLNPSDEDDQGITENLINPEIKQDLEKSDKERQNEKQNKQELCEEQKSQIEIEIKSQQSQQTDDQQLNQNNFLQIDN